MSDQAPGPVLKPAELAQLLGLPTERSVREWVHRERVPHVRVGRGFVVRLEALLEWIRDHERRSGPVAFKSLDQARRG